MEVDPVSIFYWKSPHQVSTIVRFLLVNRIQSTNQISLEGLLLTVSVIPSDLLQSTTVKHGSRSRIIQLQILIEIKKKSKTVWYITIYLYDVEWRDFTETLNFFVLSISYRAANIIRYPVNVTGISNPSLSFILISYSLNQNVLKVSRSACWKKNS